MAYTEVSAMHNKLIKKSMIATERSRLEKVSWSQ